MALPQSHATATQEIAAVTSVTSRIPDFWTDQPRVWFVRAESVLLPQKMGDDTKFNIVVSKLGKDVIQQITDILFSPPEQDKYGALKKKLLDIFEESETRQLQKLISEMDLGEQKPSQLLRRMKDLAREKLPDDTLRILWQTHLPQAVRAVLAVTETKNLDQLANVADKVAESIQPPQLAEVKTSGGLRQDQDNDVHAAIAELSHKFDQLLKSRTSSRPPYRGNSRGQRRRSQSRAPSDWVCFYHYRFKDRATKCMPPCAFKKGNP
ncbi:uncharacterized protein LOC123718332 [Pieris brassicae]|uniref:uncharacterized protein LOC123718332 n=1 Tax=Pieris brassicae TaxID=7116 RepID=UPI001E65E59C|nr:uncharacterized protein LOC123718332 [Pieris brassicae]